jgi:hypothetical protein
VQEFFFGQWAQSRLPGLHTCLSPPHADARRERSSWAGPRFHGRIAAQKGPGTFQGWARPAHFILWRVLSTPAGYVYKPGALSSNWQYGTNQYRSRVAIRPTTGATAKGHLDIGIKLYNMYAWLCFFQLGTSPTPPQKRDGGPLQNSDTKTDPRKQ